MHVQKKNLIYVRLLCLNIRLELKSQGPHVYCCRKRIAKTYNTTTAAIRMYIINYLWIMWTLYYNNILNMYIDIDIYFENNKATPMTPSYPRHHLWTGEVGESILSRRLCLDIMAVDMKSVGV